MKRLVLGLLVAVVANLATGSVALAQPKPVLSARFEPLATLIPEVVGEPTNESFWAANGDLLQQTTRGLLVWRKADNLVAFTDGARTWVNGPAGVQERANGDRFEWEAAASPPPVPISNPERLITVAWGTEQFADGHRLFYVVVTNNHPYVTATGIELVAVQTGRDGASVTEQKLPLDKTTLKPGEEARWEMDTSREFSSRELAEAYVQYYANQTKLGLEYYASWTWEGQSRRVRSAGYRVPSLI